MNISEAARWIQERMPSELLSGPPELSIYDDEAVVLLPIAVRELPGGASARRAPARRVSADRAAPRKLAPCACAWRASCKSSLSCQWPGACAAGSTEALFTTRSAPVMTRLGRAEREVLDTLVAAGVADTRSSALAYAVRAFAIEHASWLAEVRDAIAQVEQVRARLSLTPRPGPPARAEPEA